MDPVALGIVILIVVGLFLAARFSAAYIFQYIVYTFFAPRNLFWTFVTEGTAKIAVHGGKFHKIIMEWKGYDLDGAWNVVKADEAQVKRRLFGGARYIGLPPFFKIYAYRLRWSSPREDGTVVAHDEVLSHVLLKDHIYTIHIRGAEDKQRIPLDIDLLITARIVNPYKFVFNVQDAFEVVLNRIAALFRDYAGETTYEFLTSNKGDAAKIIWKKLRAKGLIQEFRENYGVEIIEQGIEIREIAPPQEYQRAATRKYLAEREREETEIRADAERRRLEAVYKAIEQFGDIGKLVRTLEAVEKSSLAASLTVQAVPGLSDVLRGVLGKPADDVTIAELRQALDEIKNIVRNLQQSQQNP
ncbi:MAG: hypothetical protein A3I38_02985 [Candidatus Wildermuthbacteria bacterium RIFCSPLOWO2_02_FULL_47_10]|nr:MAG: hypothetical protein A3I38_02985 [Candidatus Wildermuthbacteria bacterium RIFCSPLOWO2_02_FULL_47_10]